MLIFSGKVRKNLEAFNLHLFTPTHAIGKMLLLRLMILKKATKILDLIIMILQS